MNANDLIADIDEAFIMQQQLQQWQQALEVYMDWRCHRVCCT